MQEKRETVEGWSSKSNYELQKLCDPLWRELSTEEKREYNEMKKFRKEMESYGARGSKAMMSMEANLGGFLPLKSGRKVAVLVGHVETVDKVWVTPLRQAELMETTIRELNIEENCGKARLQHLSTGSIYAARYHLDSSFYRCKVLERGQHEGEVLVRFLDYGNEEKVNDIREIPEDLKNLAPLSVQVQINGLSGVPNTTKNRVRVERKLYEDFLSVIVNKKGFATFFKEDEEIKFPKKGSSKPTVLEMDKKEVMTPPSKVVIIARKKAVRSPSTLLDVPESPDEE